MFNDIGQFLAIWIFVLTGFSSVGFITFADVPELSKFSEAFLFFFQVAFGNYEIDIFEEIPSYANKPNLKIIGRYFILAFLFLNAIILLNVVIAMMANTYGIMTSEKLGIYNHSVIKTAPSYANNKHYGALAFLPAPFAIASFFTIPYYLCVKDTARLERFTTRFNMGTYFIFTILFITIFIAINLLLVPFAYLKNIWHKIILARENIISGTDVLVYAVFGLFIGILQ